MSGAATPSVVVPEWSDAGSAVDGEAATLRALHGVTRRLVRAESVPSACGIATRAARDVLGHPLSGIHVEREGRLDPVAMTEEALSYVDTVPTFEDPDTAPRRAYERGEPCVIGERDGGADDLRRLPPDSFPVESGLFLPLSDHGVFLITTTADRSLTADERSFARTLAANTEAVLDRLDRKRELERQNDRLEAFAATLSHDLRNPLSYLRGNLELAAETGDEAYFEAAEEAVDRVETLIEDVLVLARGGEVEAPEWVDLGAVVREAWSEMPADGADLAVTAPEGTWIRADRSRLRQLLANLFRNAVEHATAPRVRVGVEGDALFVADDGPGIAPEERAAVFEPGYTTDDEGTGLGLPIVAEIARAHDWEVAATESDAGGARIELRGVAVRRGDDASAPADEGG